MTDTTDQEILYNAAINSEEIGPIALGTAKSVVERMLESAKDHQASDLTKRIQAAAGESDIELILKLTDELRKAKNEEAERTARLVKLGDEFTFAELLMAFPVNYKALVYDIGLLVIKATEEGISQGRRRTRTGSSVNARPQGPTYVITRGDKSIEAQKNVGAPKAPVHEREFFEFMGFAISADGRRLEPSTFTNAKGHEVSVHSKKNVIEDLLAGNPAWTGKGYSIKVKETTEQA